MRDARNVGQPDDLITAHAAAWRNRPGFQALEFETGLGSSDKERGGQHKAIESSKIDVAAIHDIEGAGLQNQFIQDAHIGLFSLGNRDKRGDGAAQIQKRVQLDRSLGAAETRPGKQVQAKVNGGGIQDINRFLQFQSGRFILVENAGAPDELLSQIIVDAPVTLAIGVGQGAVGNFAVYPQVIELVLTRTQTGFHIAQTFPKGELTKSHAEKLIPTGERFHLIVAVIAPHTTAKLFGVDQIGELGENEFSSVHSQSLAENLLAENRANNSNRSHPLLCVPAQ